MERRDCREKENRLKLPLSFPLWLCGFPRLEKHVEVESESALVVSEEGSELWVRGVAADVERVEMVCQIDPAQRKANGVFRRDLDIFGDAGIKGQEVLESF